MYSHEVINSKDVFIVADHNQVLAPWARLRRRYTKPLNLISLDHHSDTRDAYESYIYHSPNKEQFAETGLLAELRDAFDFRCDQSTQSAILKLRHDEHIQAAILSDVLNLAFVIQLECDRGTQSEEMKQHSSRGDQHNNPFHNLPRPIPPYTYVVPASRIFVIPTLCVPGCTSLPHNDLCLRMLNDSVLEDSFLGEKIKEADDMAVCAGLSSVESQPYILDIDLDYFHTQKAAAPSSSTVFSRLVRNAEAVTIALESQCVVDHAMSGETLSSLDLLDCVRTHIGNA